MNLEQIRETILCEAEIEATKLTKKLEAKCVQLIKDNCLGEAENVFGPVEDLKEVLPEMFDGDEIYINFS